MAPGVRFKDSRKGGRYTGNGQGVNAVHSTPVSPFNGYQIQPKSNPATHIQRSSARFCSQFFPLTLFITCQTLCLDTPQTSPQASSVHPPLHQPADYPPPPVCSPAFISHRSCIRRIGRLCSPPFGLESGRSISGRTHRGGRRNLSQQQVEGVRLWPVLAPHSPPPY